MKVLRWTLQLHKWIALVVGIQVLLWALGGLVMTVIPIERVRGEHHVPDAAATTLPTTELLSLTEAAAMAGVAPARAELRHTPRGPVWALSPATGDAAVLDARTGARLAPYGDEQARAFALRAYRGEGSPVRVALLSRAPEETGKEGALWRVDFADAERTTLYLAPLTGEVVSRRSGLWRFYDFFWRLHIMDWTKGENFNHPLIIGAALLALTTILSGFVLLWSRLGRDWKKFQATRAPEGKVGIS
jgi:uncharacterized iron-regulated membrane protein